MTAVLKHMGIWRPVFLLACAAFALALHLAGPEKMYGIWGLKVTPPYHTDARGITSAIEYLKDGGKPWIGNPYDPWKRPFNYPRIWLKLGDLGIGQPHTALLAHSLMVLYFCGLLVFPPRATSVAETLALLAVAFSPAVMLGIQAGNNDQAVFFLLAVAVPTLASNRPVPRTIGVAAVAAAFLLKIFPIFGLAACARFGRRAALLLSAAAVLCAGLYAANHWEELQAIRNATPSGGAVSYGRDVLWMRVAHEYPCFTKPARMLTWLGIASGLALLPCGAVFGRRLGLATATDARATTGFLIGVAVYCGTFLMGNNWDYRLMFLVFAIPGLSRMVSRSEGPGVVIILTTLGAMACSCWGVAVWNLLRTLPGGGPASVMIDLSCKWLLFLGLMFIAGNTLPSVLAGRTCEISDKNS